ncbi:MAG: carboxyltransferase domain-containing protein, partial [Acidimicrobiales bacterium]
MSPRRVGRWLRVGDPHRFGDAAVRFDVGSALRAGAMAGAIRSAALTGVLDVVGGMDSVLVTFDPDAVAFDELTAEVRSIRAHPEPSDPKTVVLPVCFDGADLDEVAEATGLGRDGVRRALLGATLRVAVIGFAPGFAYLAGLPKALAGVSRRATPRPSVPTGSFAIAAGHAAIYPQSSPGGWNLLGRTDAMLFDAERPPFALLGQGDVVRLREVGAGELEFRPPPGGRAFAGPPEGSVFEVESPGLFSALQDRGRIGLAHLGVPGAGAADPDSHELANRLVGNGRDAATLEVTAAGPTLRCLRATHVAVVGDGVEVALDDRPVGSDRVVPVAPGQRVAIASTGRSMRAWVAIPGGFVAPTVLGSRSTDRLVGLGPGALSGGDRLQVGAPSGGLGDHLRPGVLGAGADRRRVIRVLDSDRLHPGLVGGSFEVDERSDRVGLRLRPAGGPFEVRPGDGPSAGMVTGAIQVPPDGAP